MKTKNSKFHFDNLFYFDPVKLGPFILYQIGDIYTNARYAGEPHVQVCHEISFIVSGRGPRGSITANIPSGRAMCC